MSVVKPEERGFPLKVKLTAMAKRTRALIEFYVENSNERFFTLASSDDTPDVILVDYDHEGTASNLANTASLRSDIPLLVMAFDNVKVPRAIMISKPPDSASFEVAANRALEQLIYGHRDDASDTSDTPEQELQQLEQDSSDDKIEIEETPAYFRTSDMALPRKRDIPTEKKVERYLAKVELLCGPERDATAWEDWYDRTHRYDPSRCISQLMSKALHDSQQDIKAVQIALPHTNVYALPTLNKVYTTVSLEYKTNVRELFREWDENEVQIRHFYKSDVNDVIEILNESKRYVFSGQSFSWLAELFSAQGRLPVGLDTQTNYRLRHWPNITRLELIPDCIELAAAWVNEELSLEQIIELVGCQPRYAASFFNAANAIGLIEKHGDYG